MITAAHPTEELAMSQMKMTKLGEQSNSQKKQQKKKKSAEKGKRRGQAVALVEIRRTISMLDSALKNLRPAISGHHVPTTSTILISETWAAGPKRTKRQSRKTISTLEEQDLNKLIKSRVPLTMAAVIY